MENPNEPMQEKQRDYTLSLLLAGIVTAGICTVLCVGLYLSRNYFTDTLIPRMGLTASATPATAPMTCPQIPAGWRAVMKNDFDANAYDWYLGSNVDEVAITDATVSDGVLRFTIKGFKEDGLYYYNFPEKNRSESDFYLTTGVRQLEGDNDSQYGLIFRVKGGRQHFFSIDNYGEFHLKTRDEEGNWRDILFGEYSEYIAPQRDNELAVLAQEDHFTFCINGYNVGEVDNAKYPLGEFGIGLLLARPDASATFEYDDFIIHAPE
jgi:hypothetical protein